MRKLLTNIQKELLILARDIPGLAILFLMPLLLIIVVTLTQNNALQSAAANEIEILFINHDQGIIGGSISKTLENSKEIKLVMQYDDNPLTDTLVNELVAKGKFKAGLLVKADVSDRTEGEIISAIRKLVEGAEHKAETKETDYIKIVFDPAIKPVVKTSITNAIKMAASGAESGLMTKVLFSQLSEIIVTDDPDSQEILAALQQISVDELPEQIIKVDDQYAGDTSRILKPSITQNNVPAFSLFAMFFIVIPLAGSLIAEKNEGTYDRIRTLPVSYFNILLAKALAYVLVCFMQFVLMVLVGVFVFPTLLGLPSLEMGNQYLTIIVTTIFAALSAIGFGLLVGTFSSTHNQAAMFGAILVVILASIGGVFMPIYMMPENLELVSNLSPLRWAIDGYLDIFVRGSGLKDIWINLLLLLGFFSVSLVVSAKRF